MAAQLDVDAPPDRESGSGTVTRRDLARRVSESTGVTTNLAYNMVECLFTAIRSRLVEGCRIEVRGFGALETKDTKPKPAARNPGTGELIYVPARRKVHFRPGKHLKAALHREPE